MYILSVSNSSPSINFAWNQPILEAEIAQTAAPDLFKTHLVDSSVI